MNDDYIVGCIPYLVLGKNAYLSFEDYSFEDVSDRVEELLGGLGFVFRYSYDYVEIEVIVSPTVFLQ